MVWRPLLRWSHRGHGPAVGSQPRATASPSPEPSCDDHPLAGGVSPTQFREADAAGVIRSAAYLTDAMVRKAADVAGETLGLPRIL